MAPRSLAFRMSRGTDARNHTFPEPGIAPNLLIYLKAFDPLATPAEFRLITLEDTRFLHCDMKTLNLIPNVLAAQRAAEFVQRCAAHTLALGTPVLEGVQFEPLLGELMQR